MHHDFASFHRSFARWAFVFAHAFAFAMYPFIVLAFAPAFVLRLVLAFAFALALPCSQRQSPSVLGIAISIIVGTSHVQRNCLLGFLETCNQVLHIGPRIQCVLFHVNVLTQRRRAHLAPTLLF